MSFFTICSFFHYFRVRKHWKVEYQSEATDDGWDHLCSLRFNAAIRSEWVLLFVFIARSCCFELQLTLSASQATWFGSKFVSATSATIFTLFEDGHVLWMNPDPFIYKQTPIVEKKSPKQSDSGYKSYRWKTKKQQNKHFMERQTRGVNVAGCPLLGPGPSWHQRKISDIITVQNWWNSKLFGPPIQQF